MRLVFGASAIGELLEQGGATSVEALLCAPGDRRSEDDTLLRRAQHLGVPVAEVSLDELRRHAGSRSVGRVAAQVRVADPKEIADLASSVAGRPSLVLVLDGVTDPHNLGAILRSCAAFGARAIIVPKHGSAPVNDAAVRASAGAVAHVPVLRVVNLARSIRELAGLGFWSVALGAEHEEPLWTKDLTVPVALVLGAEGSGIRAGVEKACDLRAGVPLVGPIRSLNVSVAAGVALHEVARQRWSSDRSSRPPDHSG